MLESRFSLGKSSLFLAIGLMALGVNGHFYLHGPYYYPEAWLVGGLLVAISLRGLDRRVKLRIAPDGVMYALWGSSAIPWTDFEPFTVFKYRGHSYIAAWPRNLERFRGNVSWLVRLGAWISRLSGKPAYYINASQLDVSASDIVRAISRYTPKTA